MPARSAQKKTQKSAPDLSSLVLEKVPTGIRGLDQVTHGGFPKGRTALVCGGPGTGKTLLGLEFLVRGALLYNEPGVCVAMEETSQELVTNMASLGYDLPALIRSKKLAIDYVHIERKQIEETGEYDLYGLEEYVADCVLVLDHRVTEQISTRRLRVVKYRGSSHGTNEYPFLLDDQSISVVPITSLGLTHTASTERISSGVPTLAAMLRKKGFFGAS